MKRRKNLAVHLFFIVLCIPFIIPFLYIIAISVSNEEALLKEGYRLIPVEFSLEAFRFILKNPNSIIHAYAITAIQAFIGTGLSVMVMAFCAYPLSRMDYLLAKPTMIFILITMLFSTGMVPSYIINTRYLHLGNTIWVYILPGLVNGFQLIVLRTFFRSIPTSLVESAKMDGANEFAVFFKIYMPLSKPVIATVTLLQLLDRWNSWMPSLIYITDPKYYTLQYLLQRMLREAEFIKNMAMDGLIIGNMDNQKVPGESARFAMCLIATGPMLIVFPFFQKYFTKGLTVGAVKG